MEGLQLRHVDRMYLKKFHLILIVYGVAISILTSYFVFTITTENIICQIRNPETEKTELDTFVAAKRFELPEKQRYNPPKPLFTYTFEIALFIVVISALFAFVFAIPFSKMHNNLLLVEKENEKHLKEIESIAKKDALTEIGNRYAIDERIDTARALFERYDIPFSALLIDIDFFKKINDNYGHLMGDYVLQEVCKTFQKHARETDFCGRWGGEEFIIICEETNLEGACELAKHIKNAVENHNFEDIPSQTVSIGVAEYTRKDNIKSFLKRLDAGVYKAKGQGRNCIATA